MSSTNGDYIGTESCIDDVNHDDVDDLNDPGSPIFISKQTKSRKKMEKREFPPPIPLLARTQNLWELKRYYTSDGRLILRQEKVRHHYYFLAHRANGRLTLQLVPFDPVFDMNSLPLSAHHDTREVEDEAASPPQTDDDDKEDTDNDGTGQVSGANDGFRDEGPDIVADGLSPAGPAGAKNCNLNFNRSSASSCLFQMHVYPIRTIRG